MSIYIDTTGLATMIITAEHSAEIAKQKESMEPLEDFYKKMSPIIASLKNEMSNKVDDNW